MRRQIRIIIIKSHVVSSIRSSGQVPSAINRRVVIALVLRTNIAGDGGIAVRLSTAFDWYLATIPFVSRLASKSVMLIVIDVLGESCHIKKEIHLKLFHKQISFFILEHCV